MILSFSGSWLTLWFNLVALVFFLAFQIPGVGKIKHFSTIFATKIARLFIFFKSPIKSRLQFIQILQTQVGVRWLNYILPCSILTVLPLILLVKEPSRT